MSTKTKTYKKNPDARTEKYCPIFSKTESAAILAYRNDMEKHTSCAVTKSTAVWKLTCKALIESGHLE